jgi:acyl-CoA thioester hydrolase
VAHWPSDVSPRVVETRLRVRYAETDQMGVVYYANYLVWMEIGRVEYCRAMGVRYREMEQEDRVLLTVVESNCRYLYPAKYDDEIIVKTWLSQAHARIVTFAYEMLNVEDGRKLITGSTKHVFCGPDLQPTKLPQKYWKEFGLA